MTPEEQKQKYTEGVLTHNTAFVEACEKTLTEETFKAVLMVGTTQGKHPRILSGIQDVELLVKFLKVMAAMIETGEQEVEIFEPPCENENGD